jgi:putative FmdB family regulatory protein
MPIYEYECAKCKSRVEVFQKMTDKPPTKCKKCGGRLEKQVSASAIQFKGSGWYVTDYAGAGKKAAEKSEREATVTDDHKSDKADKVDKADKKTKTTESSPAKKTSEKASTPKAKGD